jgi:hypothetical protein
VEKQLIGFAVTNKHDQSEQYKKENIETKYSVDDSGFINLGRNDEGIQQYRHLVIKNWSDYDVQLTVERYWSNIKR